MVIELLYQLINTFFSINLHTKLSHSSHDQKYIIYYNTFFDELQVVQEKKFTPRKAGLRGVNDIIRLCYFRLSDQPFIASSTATAQATVAPTMGLLPMPMSPIIST